MRADADRSYCANSSWNGLVKLREHTTGVSLSSTGFSPCPGGEAGCPPTVRGVLQQVWLPDDGDGSAAGGTCVAGCPDGHRTEVSSKRSLLDCEPWLHQEPPYVGRARGDTIFCTGTRKLVTH